MFAEIHLLKRKSKSNNVFFKRKRNVQSFYFVFFGKVVI